MLRWRVASIALHCVAGKLGLADLPIRYDFAFAGRGAETDGKGGGFFFAVPCWRVQLDCLSVK